MRAILDMLESAQKGDVQQLITDSLQEAAPTYTSELEKQMLDGVMEDGSQIGTYSPMWAAIRKAHGLQVEYVDGHFTGAMHRGLFLQIGGTDMETGSNVPYAQDFQDRYGDEVFAAGGDYLEPFVDEVEQKLMEKIENALNQD